MSGIHQHVGNFFTRSKRHWQQLLPDGIAKNPYLAWSLFGASALAPIAGYEAERLRKDRMQPEETDEPDIKQAQLAIEASLGKAADITSVLATELAEQTLIRGLDNLRSSVRGAKERGIPGLPKLPEEDAEDTAVRNASRKAARKRMA